MGKRREQEGSPVLFEGFSERHKDEIIGLYNGLPGMAVDHLPYTEGFERMYVKFIASTRAKPSRHEFWLQILRLRKAGKLSRKFFAP